MNRLLLLLYLLLTLPLLSQAQDPIILTLEEVIEKARTQSPAAFRAQTMRENRYWQYRTYLSNYKPQLSLQGNFPDFDRRFRPITQEDGTVEFQPVFNNNSAVNLALSQSIGLLGTRIFINSEVQRFDDFDRDTHRYSATPVAVGFFQPVFAFNQLAWDRRIEPLRFEESRKAYFQELEQIAVIATNLYFNLLLAQIDMEIANLNLANNDTIFQIAQGRYNLGKIAENELLQLELNLMNSRQGIAQAELDLQTFSYRLKSFIGMPGNQAIELALPNDLPVYEVNETVAIRQGLVNRPEAVEFKRMILEARREVARARGNNGFNAFISASVGLTNRAFVFDELYEQPANQQVFQIRFSVPIVDWGRNRSRMKTALANQQLIQYTVSQDSVNFREEIFTQVNSFKMLRNQVEVAESAAEIGIKSYDIAKSRFLIGKISITDLNDALERKDSARRTYIQSLRDFWIGHYNLRQLTLYSFPEQETLFLTE